MTKKRTGVKPAARPGTMPVVVSDDSQSGKSRLTKLERQARREASQSIRVAAFGGNFNNSVGGSIMQADSAFYSPQLSTDFLELPQSEREKRELIRFWYSTHPVVGAAIDFHCFPPGAPVVLRDGSVKPIEAMNVGDEVLNGFGEPTRVIQTFRHDIDGPITRIKVRGVQDPISCTQNHPFLVYRAEKVDCVFPQYGLGACKRGARDLCRQKKCSGSDLGPPEFVFAEDLRVGDYICSPSITASRSSFNRNLLRLLGYYAAEGSLSRTKYGALDRVVFTLNSDEFETVAEEISALFQEEYSHSSRKRKRTDSNSCDVKCYLKEFADLCYKHVGSGSRTKRLSLDLMESPREDVLEFLGAYWNGDGSLTKNGYVATTGSLQMANQVFALAHKVGFNPRLRSFVPKPSKTGFKHNGPIYRVIIPYRFHVEFSKYANFVQGGYSANSTREFSVRVGNHELKRIERVETVPYDGPVYNVEIDGDGDRKSYVAYGLSTHNTDVPMSKIRLSLPRGKDVKRNKQILHFYESMCRRVRLFQTLYDATHEYWLHGNVYIFCEDHDVGPEIPESIVVDEEEEEIGEIDYSGRAVRKSERRKRLKPESDRADAIHEFVRDNYKGWQRLQILPPEQVKLEVFQYTNRTRMELIPSEKDRLVVLKASEQNDAEASRIADDIPEQIRDSLLSGQPIPLNTSPYDDYLCSSFCYHLAHKKSPYDDRGISILERCHLPGTEVTAFRGGQVLQIPIEDLDPESDKVLGGSGKWRKFRSGSRPYTGPVLDIGFSKLPDPVSCTSDHKMWVLRDGTVQEIQAKDVVPGDLVRTASVDPGPILQEIDLFKFFKEETWTYEHRDTGEERQVSIVPRISGNKLVLRHEWTDENPQRSSKAKVLSRVIEWIGTLKESVAMVAEDFCAMFDNIGASVYRALVRDLEAVGYQAPVVVVESSRFKSKGRLFKPAQLDVSKLYQKSEEQDCPKSMKLTRELGFMIGYFLGDGCVSARKSPTLYGPFDICYSSESSNSKSSLEIVNGCLHGMDLDIRPVFRTSRVPSIQSSTDWFNRWIGRNFGHNKEDKHLPAWVFSAPEEFQIGLLNGLVDSDGWGSSYKNQPGYADCSVGMTTATLVDQIQTLAYGLGFGVSRRYKAPREVRQANGKMSPAKALHTLVWGCSEDLQRLQSGGSVKLGSLELQDRSRSGRKHVVHEGHIYLPVKSVESRQYDGFVHSLDVEEDHSFFVNFTLTSNCLRTLLYQDKLRQAQTQIASRAMTPKRIVWADKMSERDVEDLRDQIDQALIDPDFTIVTNFEVHWDEIGARDRLLDLGTEYEITNKLLYIGMRITESMLTGESSYSGERIHLDVMNTMYLLYRETIAEFVEQQLFAPVAEKKGFWEEDEYGNRVLLYPKLQFTRLALRDNTELQDFMYNLYQKGSLPIAYIYELLNIDVEDAHAQLAKDLWTQKDSNMNRLLESLLTKAGEDLLEETDVKDLLSKNLGLKRQEKDGSRFGSKE